MSPSTTIRWLWRRPVREFTAPVAEAVVDVPLNSLINAPLNATPTLCDDLLHFA